MSFCKIISYCRSYYQMLFCPYQRTFMEEKNLMLLPVEQLPQTDEKKEKPRVNCLQDMLLELMEERKVSLAQIQKGTGISWGTLMGWHDGSVNCQLADKNLLRLAQFFNVDLFYLLYGIGDDSPYFEDFKNEA